MPSTLRRAPRYCRQKENGRPDRAYVKIDGKRILLGTHGSPESYKKYAQLISGELKVDKPVWVAQAPSVPTVSMLMVEYLTYAIRKYGGDAASEVVHIRQAFRILRHTHGATFAKDFGPKAYQQMRLAMIEAGWSRRYIRDQCQRVKRLIGWGVVEEILPPNAKHALEAVPGLTAGEFGVRETAEVPPVPDEIIASTLPYLRPTVADMVRIQRLTGMRPGEVVQLSSEHIDRSGDVWMFKPPSHKTQKRGKQRTIAIGPKAQGLLSKYLFAARCFRYSSASYRRAIHRACRRAGLQKWSPNQLRHTAATEIRQHFGLKHAQVALGHSRARTTEIYALANQAKAIEVALQIG
jgi:integrase